MPHPKRRISDAEGKLTLLYCVNALEILTPAQLWQFVGERELLEYIPAQLALGELLDSGEIEKGSYGLKEHIYLTSAGKRALTLFEKRVPASVRALIDEAAPDFRRLLIEKRRLRAVYEKRSSEGCRVYMSLSESEIPVIYLRLRTPGSKRAGGALRRFGENVTALLKYLYSLPLQAERAPDKCYTMHSLTEYSIALTLPPYAIDEETVMEAELGMLLPSVDAARGLYGAITARAAEVSERIAHILCLYEPDLP